MCFTIHPKHPIAKIAKKDIICWKIVKKNLTPAMYGPLYRSRPYILGKLNPRITLRVEKETNFWSIPKSEINAGYHSYSCISQLKRDMQRYYSVGPLAYSTVQCIIPKGEVYFFNPKEHQYVSSNIIIKEIIK